MANIESVTSTRNRYGFYIHASTGITIKDSSVQANIYGLHLQDSSNNVVQHNDLPLRACNQCAYLRSQCPIGAHRWQGGHRLLIRAGLSRLVKRRHTPIIMLGSASASIIIHQAR